MRARDITRLAVALILVALGAFAIAAFLVDVDKAVGGEFSVWERVGVLGLALLVLAPLFFYRARTGKGGVLATLQGTALWVPWIAAIASSALYLASIEGNPFWRDNALLLGSAVAGVLWLLHALVDIDYATAKRQSPGWYGLLQGEIGALRREVNGPSEPRLGGPTGEWVRRQARGQLDQIESELRQTGLPWVTRSGFNSTWTHFHLAESIWIEASPTPSVIALAVGDIMRLEGRTSHSGPTVRPTCGGRSRTLIRISTHTSKPSCPLTFNASGRRPPQRPRRRPPRRSIRNAGREQSSSPFTIRSTTTVA